MKILFDTNVILDVMLDRKEFVDISAHLVGCVESGRLEGFLCATTVTTLDYLITKTRNKKLARVAIEQLLKLFHIADVNAAVLELAVKSKFSDFEDAVQYYSGELCGVQGLVTRNAKDYQHAGIPVYSPGELLKILTIKAS